MAFHPCRTGWRESWIERFIYEHPWRCVIHLFLSVRYVFNSHRLLFQFAVQDIDLLYSNLMHAWRWLWLDCIKRCHSLVKSKTQSLHIHSRWDYSWCIPQKGASRIWTQRIKFIFACPHTHTRSLSSNQTPSIIADMQTGHFTAFLFRSQSVPDSIASNSLAAVTS